MVWEIVLASAWGFLGGFALLLGSFFAYYFKIPQKIVAGIMAFGSGVLLSAISFELLDEAFKLGGIHYLAIGFIIGALIFTIANIYLSKKGAKHRKRSKKPDDFEGDGTAIAVGSIIDGIPESIALGLTMIGGTGVSTATMVAIFLSNIPEGLSSTVGMKESGWGKYEIFGLWFVIAIVTSISSVIGFSVFRGLDVRFTAVALAIAAGGILAMVSDTMIPEAFSQAHDFSGLLVVFGFVVSFVLSHVY